MGKGIGYWRREDSLSLRGRGKRTVARSSPQARQPELAPPTTGPDLEASFRTEDGEGNIFWKDTNGGWHRVDGPAAIFPDGEERWYHHSLLHRDGGPAITRPDGSEEWYQYDRCHRAEGPAISRFDGSKEYWVNGQLHREDGPAAVRASGTEEWYQHGKWHREDGPAIIYDDGKTEWFQEGVMLELGADGKPDLSLTDPANTEATQVLKMNYVKWLDDDGEEHRANGPAVIYDDGGQEWYQHGKRHRENDLPALMEADGSEEWWVDGKCHRDGNPAVVSSDGAEGWFVHGQRHREDGPAVTDSDGSKQWYLHGEEFTEQEFHSFFARQRIQQMMDAGNDRDDSLADSLLRRRPNTIK